MKMVIKLESKQTNNLHDTWSKIYTKGIHDEL